MCCYSSNIFVSLRIHIQNVPDLKCDLFTIKTFDSYFRVEVREKAHVGHYKSICYYCLILTKKVMARQ